jgi:serine/threonine protein phosphatase PrpC
MSSPPSIRLIAAGKTDVGRRRQHNEDSFLCDAEQSFFIVADGMGGHAAGEIASAEAVEVMRKFVASFQGAPDFTWPFGVERGLSPQENLIVNAIKLANRCVCNLAHDHPEYSGMGTTVVSCRVDGREAVIGHVGDSRAYLFRGGKLTLLTEDHSWVNEQVQQRLLTEEEARTHRWRNIITRALGNRFEVEVDLQRSALELGDTLVLCTDGLSGPVPVDTIAEILAEHGEKVADACNHLVDEANRCGGPDNITVIVIRVAPA